MNITITRDQLMNGLQAVQNIVGHRTTLPILSNVLFRAQDNGLELTATDLDVTIACSVAAQVKKLGATTLPVKKLFAIVRELNAGDIVIEVDDKNRCSLSAGASHYKIHGLAAEEFPPLPQFRDERKVVLDQKKVKGMMRKTGFAVSTDEARYVLNGIFLSLKDHKFTMVATDGRRLALVEEEVDIPERGQGEFIVPTKAVNELTRLLTDVGVVEIQFTENQASFSLKAEDAAPIQVITKLVEGTYPNYRQVIPAETKERITLLRDEFMHALRRAEVMTSDKQSSVKLIFGANNLTIIANTPEVGEGQESIAVNYQGKEMAIAFNPGFLILPLAALEENDEVFLDLVDEFAPAVIRINGPFLYVVMPMRLS
jgi:DNA polymerase-3 subunit beta